MKDWFVFKSFCVLLSGEHTQKDFVIHGSMFNSQFICIWVSSLRASLAAQTVENLPAVQETRFDPCVRKTLWRREWLLTLVFLPGELYGQRNLAGYSPGSLKESDTTERLTLSRFTFFLHFIFLRVWHLLLQLMLCLLSCTGTLDI